MIHGSLFSGIGGFDLAAEWMGWQNAFHCEFNSFCQQILKYYWPNAETYTDIRETDFTIWTGRIDILTGGFPCQPYSTAGKRKGKEDKRHLWPEMLRAIREIRPRWIVGENVRGIISWNAGLVFEEVQAELEVDGYEVQPFVLPAASVGAPHRRDRVWFVAYSGDGIHAQGLGHGIIRREKETSEGSHQHQNERNENRQRVRPEPATLGNQQPPAHPHHPRSSTPGRGTDAHGAEEKPGWEEQLRHGAGGPGNEWDVADANGQGLPGGYEPGNSGSPGAPPPGQEPKGRFAEPNWEKFPTQPPVLHGDDGLSAPMAGYTARQWYNEHIKAAGNAIVPQVALQIFRAIDAYEEVVFS